MGHYRTYTLALTEEGKNDIEAVEDRLKSYFGEEAFYYLKPEMIPQVTLDAGVFVNTQSGHMATNKGVKFSEAATNIEGVRTVTQTIRR